MTQQVKDAIKQLVTALTALMGFLTIIGIRFEWFTIESINAFGVFLGALIALVITLYGIWMNTYTRYKAFQEAERKKKIRLEEEAAARVAKRK